MNNKQYILHLGIYIDTFLCNYKLCGFWFQRTFLTPILCLKIQIYKFTIK